MKRFLIALALFSPVAAIAEPCDRFIQGMYEGFPGSRGPGQWFDAKGSRLTARGGSAYTSHAMSPNFRPDLSLPQKSRMEGFSVSRQASGPVITGRFLDVFPGRSDGAADLTTLSIHRNGRVQITMNQWGSSSYFLTNLNCESGHMGTGFVLRGQHRSAAFGLDTWTFFFSPNWLD